MRIASKRHTAVAMAATATLVVSACGGQGSADVDAETLNAMSVEELAEAAKGEEVYWLTTMYPTETAQKVADAFTAKYPGITVQVDRKTANENWQTLRTSKSVNNAEADVFSSTQVFFYDMAKEAGYVDCYLPESAKDLDKKYLDPNGCWFAARESVFTLAYNTDKVDPADVPKSYLDLADPKWRGQIGMLDPALSNNAFSAYFTMSRKIGNGDLDATKDYWQKVGANKPVLYKEGGALINAVASGEVAVAWVFDYRAWELKDSGAPVALATPKEGVVSNSDFTALVSDTDAPHAARLFMHFLASNEAMQIGAKDAYYYGLRDDIPVYPKDRPPLRELDVVAPDWDDQEKNHDKFLNLWNEAVKGRG